MLTAFVLIKLQMHEQSPGKVFCLEVGMNKRIHIASSSRYRLARLYGIGLAEVEEGPVVFQRCMSHMLVKLFFRHLNHGVYYFGCTYEVY